MKTVEQSQDPLFIEENPLLSHLYLTYAVYPFLTKLESNMIEAVWQRTGRFSIAGYTMLTLKFYNEGQGDTIPRGQNTQEDRSIWGSKRLPIYEDMIPRTFTRVRSRLHALGLIQQQKEHSSFYRLSCYPLDYVDTSKRLISALSRDESPTGYGILREISRMTETLRRFKKL